MVIRITRRTEENVTHHTSHVTCHTSHITHHESHTTHCTSHITRHASHITHHTVSRGGKAGAHSAIISLLQRPLHMMIRAEALLAAAECDRGSKTSSSQQGAW